MTITRVQCNTNEDNTSENT